MQQQFHRVVLVLVPQIILISPPDANGIIAADISVVLPLADASHMMRTIGIDNEIEVVVRCSVIHEVRRVIPVKPYLFINDLLQLFKVVVIGHVGNDFLELPFY